MASCSWCQKMGGYYTLQSQYLATLVYARWGSWQKSCASSDSLTYTEPLVNIATISGTTLNGHCPHIIAKNNLSWDKQMYYCAKWIHAIQHEACYCYTEHVLPYITGYYNYIKGFKWQSREIASRLHRMTISWPLARTSKDSNTSCQRYLALMSLVMIWLHVTVLPGLFTCETIVKGSTDYVYPIVS